MRCRARPTTGRPSRGMTCRHAGTAAGTPGLHGRSPKPSSPLSRAQHEGRHLRVDRAVEDRAIPGKHGAAPSGGGAGVVYEPSRSVFLGNLARSVEVRWCMGRGGEGVPCMACGPACGTVSHPHRHACTQGCRSMGGDSRSAGLLIEHPSALPPFLPFPNPRMRTSSSSSQHRG